MTGHGARGSSGTHRLQYCASAIDERCEDCRSERQDHEKPSPFRTSIPNVTVGPSARAVRTTRIRVLRFSMPRRAEIALGG
jgi:hypothetical protein